MFGKLSVHYRLAGALSALTALLLWVAVQKLVVIDRASDDVSVLVSGILSGTLPIGEVQKLIIDAERLLLVHVAFDAPAKKEDAESQLAQLQSRIATLFAGLQRRSEDSGELDALAIAGQDLMRVQAAAEEAIALSRAGKRSEALEVVENKSLQAYAALVVHFDGLFQNSRAAANRLAGDSLAALETERTETLWEGGLALLFAGLSSWLLVRMVSRPLRKALGLAEAISRGDLTSSGPGGPVQASGEFQTLLVALDRMRGELAAAVRRIGRTSSSLESVGTQLDADLGVAAEAAEKIRASVGEVWSHVRTQTDSVEATSTAVGRMTGSLGTLVRQVADQTESVALSSTSLEKMAANTETVNASVARMGVELRSLMKVADSGHRLLGEAADKIRLVSTQGERLLEANDLIRQVASQTNLLAMNAAIEAAHAGDAGRGFSVVADEIRKLAELSGAQSLEISRDIASILSEIESVVALSRQSEQAFGEVIGEISVISESEDEIRLAMEDQTRGSEQILEAMARLSTAAGHVGASTQELGAESQTILGEVSSLRERGTAVERSLGAMAAEAQRVQALAVTLEEMGQSNTRRINELTAVVGQFVVDPEPTQP